MIKRTNPAYLGSKTRPRVSVDRSNKHIYIQFIDDEKGVTLLSHTDKKIKDTKAVTKTQKAFAVGLEAAEAAKAKKITTVIYDRGQYRYHGRVKAVAEGMRKGGLKV